MTNGVVSVLVDGKVAMKIVVGCDGYRAGKLAELIRKANRVPDVVEARALADAVGFGCGDCRAIGMPENPFNNASLWKSAKAEFSSEGLKCYYDSFSDPEANPRWEYRADHTKIVYLVHADQQLGESRAPEYTSLVRRILVGVLGSRWTILPGIHGEIFWPRTTGKRDSMPWDILIERRSVHWDYPILVAFCVGECKTISALRDAAEKAVKDAEEFDEKHKAAMPKYPCRCEWCEGQR